MGGLSLLFSIRRLQQARAAAMGVTMQTLLLAIFDIAPILALVGVCRAENVRWWVAILLLVGSALLACPLCGAGRSYDLSLCQAPHVPRFPHPQRWCFSALFCGGHLSEGRLARDRGHSRVENVGPDEGGFAGTSKDRVRNQQRIASRRPDRLVHLSNLPDAAR